jgi:threonine dehydrogenase-like Zn-dependent dehydrogenase
MGIEPKFIPSPTKYDSSQTILATTWQGTKKIEVKEFPKPVITDPTDAIVQVTRTAICGSDLHFYTGYFPGMKPDDIVGHEWMGIVEDVGSEVKKVKKGDRVVSSFHLHCGRCKLCDMKEYTLCDNTNPSKEMEQQYGDRISGMYGYSHLTGGYAGGQAEYVRSLLADQTLLKVPDDMKNVSDAKLHFLSDIYPTAWHGNELAGVGKDTIVAIWGAGPVGMLAAKLAFIRGAKRVIQIDNVEYRLNFLKAKVPGVETVNFDKVDVVKTLKQMTDGHGPDAGIECVGMHYTKTTMHAAELKAGLETDSGDTVNEMLMAVRKGGRLGIIGAYADTVNHYKFGCFMEKGMHMSGGQCPTVRYWPHLIQLIKDGKIDPSFVITHELPLEAAAKGYHIFNDKLDNVVKVVLIPGKRA